MIDYKALGAAIRSIRESKEWKRERLAAEADISLKTLINVELGREPNLSTVDQIAQALDLKVSTIIKRAEQSALVA